MGWTFSCIIRPVWIRSDLSHKINIRYHVSKQKRYQWHNTDYSSKNKPYYSVLYHWTYTTCFRSILFFPSTVVKYHYSSDHDHGWTNGYTQHNNYNYVSCTTKINSKHIACTWYVHAPGTKKHLKKSMGEQIARYMQHIAIMHTTK